MLILLERETPQISTDSALDHSHLATQWTCVKNMQIYQTYVSPMPIPKIRTDTTQHLASCTAGKRFSKAKRN